MLYDFETSKGQRIQLAMPLEQYERRISASGVLTVKSSDGTCLRAGTKLTRVLDRSRKRRSGEKVDPWDTWESDNLSVPTFQQDELIAHYKKHGITGLSFNERGKLVGHGRDQRKRCAQSRRCAGGGHIVDYDGGYGDP